MRRIIGATSLEQRRGMPLAVDERHDLRLVDRGVGLGEPVGVDRVLVEAQCSTSVNRRGSAVEW